MVLGGINIVDQICLIFKYVWLQRKKKTLKSILNIVKIFILHRKPPKTPSRNHSAAPPPMHHHEAIPQMNPSFCCLVSKKCEQDHHKATLELLLFNSLSKMDHRSIDCFIDESLLNTIIHHSIISLKPPAKPTKRQHIRGEANLHSSHKTTKVLVITIHWFTFQWKSSPSATVNTSQSWEGLYMFYAMSTTSIGEAGKRILGIVRTVEKLDREKWGTTWTTIIFYSIYVIYNN